jgi:ketosteroid isomerase-like protein
MSLPNRVAPPADSTLEERLQRVEDQLSIRDLTARYNFAIDNRDLDAVRLLFAPNASFGSKDGAMRATGVEAILEQFKSRFSVLGATNHFAHDHVIWFEGTTLARGMLSVHAEVWRKEQPMVTALRYDDVYEKIDGLWRFSERLLSFFYYLNVMDYPQALGRLERNMASGTPVAADFPERLPTYVEMRPGRAGADGLR